MESEPLKAAEKEGVPIEGESEDSPQMEKRDDAHFEMKLFSGMEKCSEWNITFYNSSILLIGSVIRPIHMTFMDLISDCVYIYEIYSPPIPQVGTQFSIWKISFPECEFTSPKNIDRPNTDAVSLQASGDDPKKSR